VSSVNEDPNPLPTDSGGGGGSPDPDAGKDLSYLDPFIEVNNSEPSYNQDPPGAGGGDGSGQSMAADPGPIRVDLGSLRSVEQTLLSGTQEAGNMYTDLRNAVMGSASNQYFWGPTPPGPLSVNNPVIAHDGLGDGGNDPGADEQQQLSDMGKQFGSEIVPVMEKALYQVAGALEVLGTFIAAVNTTGQSYGYTDRSTTFPAPPA
jgi:hypothetical protein